jgi:hypothetical protein
MEGKCEGGDGPFVHRRMEPAGIVLGRMRENAGEGELN